jgi:hypothetical protein
LGGRERTGAVITVDVVALSESGLILAAGASRLPAGTRALARARRMPHSGRAKSMTYTPPDAYVSPTSAEFPALILQDDLIVGDLPE